jgi:hypothetical protein
VFAEVDKPRRHGDGRSRDLQALFIDGLAFRTALAFLVACVFVVPAGRPAAQVALGAMWGVLVALVQAVLAVAVDRDGIAEGWTRARALLFAEILPGFALLACGLVSIVFDRPTFWPIPELVVPAALAFVATYGLIHLATAIAARARRRVHEPTPAAPDENGAASNY